MAKSWVGHNNKVFQTMIEKHRKALEKAMRKMFNDLARGIVDYIETFIDIEGMPYYSGNLADGTGVGVYMNGQLMGYMPQPSATEPQEYDGNDNIWGTEYLFEALSAGEGEFAKGIWVVLFSTVPYAVMIDEEGAPYTDVGFFSETLKDEMLDKFKIAFAREFPNVAKQITI